MEEYGKRMENSTVADQTEADGDGSKFTPSKINSTTTTETKGIFVTQKGKRKGYDTLEKTIIVAPQGVKKKKQSIILPD